MANRPDDVGSFGEAVYEQLAPLAWDDENQDWALLIFIGALGQMLQDVDDYAHSGPNGEPPWSALLDINRIPDSALPWLGQFIGVSVNLSLSYEEQRQQIRDHLGWGRGTIAALRASVRDFLVGTRTVDIVERDTSPYHLSVVTYASETPSDITYSNIYGDYLTYLAFYNAFGSYQEYWDSGGRQRILNTLQANKPAGLVLSYTVQPGSPGTFEHYEQVWLRHATYQDVWDTLQNYDELYLNP